MSRNMTSILIQILGPLEMEKRTTDMQHGEAKYAQLDNTQHISDKNLNNILQDEFPLMRRPRLMKRKNKNLIRGILSDTSLCKSENMNPYSTQYGFIFSLLQSGVSDLHHEQSGVRKKGNPMFHYIKEEYSGIWDLNSHIPLHSNFSTVKIWMESGVRGDIRWYDLVYDGMMGV